MLRHFMLRLRHQGAELEVGRETRWAKIAIVPKQTLTECVLDGQDSGHGFVAKDSSPRSDGTALPALAYNIGKPINKKN